MYEGGAFNIIDIHNNNNLEYVSKLNQTNNLNNDLIQVIPRNMAIKNFQDCQTKFEEFLKKLNTKRISLNENNQNNSIYHNNLERQNEYQRHLCLLNQSSCDTKHNDSFNEMIGSNLRKYPYKESSITQSNKFETKNGEEKSIIIEKQELTNWKTNNFELSKEYQNTNKEFCQNKKFPSEEVPSLLDEIEIDNNEKNASDIGTKIPIKKDDLKAKISRETTAKEEIEEWD